MPDFTVTHCEVIDRALASSAGKLFAERLERAEEALKELCSYERENERSRSTSPNCDCAELARAALKGEVGE
jgi:hypothetical protein